MVWQVQLVLLNLEVCCIYYQDHAGSISTVRGAKSSSLSGKLAEMRLKQTAKALGPVPEVVRCIHYELLSAHPLSV